MLIGLTLTLNACTTLTLESGAFRASRTALFTDVRTDLELCTPDGAKVTARGLQSTVNTQLLESLISAASKP